MIRKIIIVMVFLCTTLFIQAEIVSLSGTVKKTGGSVGIPGILVKVATYNHLSATTDANGAFTINGATTSVQSPAQH